MVGAQAQAGTFRPDASQGDGDVKRAEAGALKRGGDVLPAECLIPSVPHDEWYHKSIELDGAIRAHLRLAVPDTFVVELLYRCEIVSIWIDGWSKVMDSRVEGDGLGLRNVRTEARANRDASVIRTPSWSRATCASALGSMSGLVPAERRSSWRAPGRRRRPGPCRSGKIPCRNGTRGRQ